MLPLLAAETMTDQVTVCQAIICHVVMDLACSHSYFDSLLLFLYFVVILILVLVLINAGSTG